MVRTARGAADRRKTGVGQMPTSLRSAHFLIFRVINISFINIRACNLDKSNLPICLVIGEASLLSDRACTTRAQGPSDRCVGSLTRVVTNIVASRSWVF